MTCTIGKPMTVLAVAAVVGLLGLLAPAPASAAGAPRVLNSGDRGEDVLALKVKVAGWYRKADQSTLRMNGYYGTKTVKAVTAFQRHYGLAPDGAAGPKVFRVLAGLEDDDLSTAHFDWSEFKQNYNPDCSDEANKYARSFKGGLVRRGIVKENVRRLMWRLEALRAKAGDQPVAITSGFRSVAYNKCIGGASASQHLFGTAIDLRVGGISNRGARDKARGSQFSGIGCYSRYTHNHLDLRLENHALPAAQYWWWPEQDSQGHDLADDDRPCYGETSSTRLASVARLAVSFLSTRGSYIPTRTEISNLGTTHETLNWGD